MGTLKSEEAFRLDDLGSERIQESTESLRQSNFAGPEKEKETHDMGEENSERTVFKSKFRMCFKEEEVINLVKCCRSIK